MNYAQLLAPDFALILMGYLLCRFSSLDRRVWEQIDKLVYYFLFPILMFSSIVKTPIQFDMVASFIPAGLLLAFITIGLAYALPYLPSNTNSPYVIMLARRKLDFDSIHL